MFAIENHLQVQQQLGPKGYSGSWSDGICYVISSIKIRLGLYLQNDYSVAKLEMPKETAARSSKCISGGVAVVFIVVDICLSYYIPQDAFNNLFYRVSQSLMKLCSSIFSC